MANTAEEIMREERASVDAWKAKQHAKKMAIRGNKHMQLSHRHSYNPPTNYSADKHGSGSTRTHFKGTGTHLEATKKGIKGFYHGTDVAKMDKKGDLHFNSGGYYTPTTARRMETFAREHGGAHHLSIGRRKGSFRAFNHGKEIAHSAGGRRMTVKAKALANRMK